MLVAMVESRPELWDSSRGQDKGHERVKSDQNSCRKPDMIQQSSDTIRTLVLQSLRPPTEVPNARH